MALHVANRGRVIPLDRRDGIFRAFVSGHDGLHSGDVPGLGLGLAFCKLAVEAHDGTISLESPWQERGDGVKVTVALPAARVMQP